MTPAQVARFWSKVDKGPGCWRWTGALNGSGYGTVRVGSRTDGTRRSLGAHVVALILDGRGPPPGMVGHHACFNRWCVNALHLEVRTKGENNALRAPGFVHPMTLRTHCPAGHPYVGQNLIRERGARVCRACRNARSLAGYHRRTA